MKNLKWFIGLWLKNKKIKEDEFVKILVCDLNLARNDVSQLKSDLHNAKKANDWLLNQLNLSENELTRTQYNFKLVEIEFKNWRSINEQSQPLR